MEQNSAQTNNCKTEKKIFDNNALTKKQLRKELIEFAAEQRVKKVVFNSKSKRLLGSYIASKKIIFLNNLQTKKSMLLTFFHELAHHHAVIHKKWRNFHYDKKKFTAKQTFNIENKIDKIAKKLWNNYVDVKAWGKYKFVYPVSSKHVLVKWFKDNENLK